MSREDITPRVYDAEVVEVNPHYREVEAFRTARTNSEGQAGVEAIESLRRYNHKGQPDIRIRRGAFTDAWLDEDNDSLHEELNGTDRLPGF